MLTPAAADRLIERAGAAFGGSAPARARGYIVAVHGRGADAASILGLVDALATPDLCAIAPDAPGRTWYPHSFMAPFEANEPSLSHAIARVHALLDLIEEAGAHASATALIGFSQGACLALESAIRRPRPYGAIIALSGGYIGPPGLVRADTGRLDGARAFLGCSDVDPHIPLARVRETTAHLQSLGAQVTERIYPGFGHAVNEDEISHARRLLSSIGRVAPPTA